MVKPTDTEIEELAESWLNGNRTYVIDEIIAMTPADAAYITAKIIREWIRYERHADVGGLIAAIGRRIED